jgi:tRNA-2-methylthio-N6-dimethylallyladenosine synthase
MKPRYYIQTYGCQMNVHDSERMAGMLDDLGYEPTATPEAADVLLMNTCAVRERPEHKLYSELGVLRKLKATNPDLVIGVAGCMAQREADTIRRRVPEVDILLGPRNLHHLPHLLRQTQRRQAARERAEQQHDIALHEYSSSGDLHEYSSSGDLPNGIVVTKPGNHLPQKIAPSQQANEAAFSDGLDLECDPTPATPVRRRSTISAYVDVIFGCNFNCTYCAVPSARGREVSRKPQEILDEVRQLRDLGYREITLLGQTVNAYGHDLERDSSGKRVDFAGLLEDINTIDPTLRVRFTSPHPMYFNARLIDTIAALPSVCEHLHMPLQSGDNGCLRRMKRTYTVERYREIVERVREKMPDVAITTDLIVGFCGETESEFENTLKAVREIDFDQAYMFAYSPRHTTEAWLWPDDVPADVKQKRLAELVAVFNHAGREKNRPHVGKTVEVLVENLSDKDANRVIGRTRTNKLIVFPGDLDSYPIGSFVEVKTQEAFLWGFRGEVVRALQPRTPLKTMIELVAA